LRGAACSEPPPCNTASSVGDVQLRHRPPLRLLRPTVMAASGAGIRVPERMLDRHDVNAQGRLNLPNSCYNPRPSGAWRSSASAPAWGAGGTECSDSDGLTFKRGAFSLGRSAVSRNAGARDCGAKSLRRKSLARGDNEPIVEPCRVGGAPALCVKGTDRPPTYELG